MNFNWATMVPILTKALGETFQMIGIALAFTIVFGLLVGVLLVSTDEGGVYEAPLGSRRLGVVIHAVLGFIVNIGRSLPFIILMVVLIPFTRLIIGTFIGPTAAAVPLTIAAIPFFARLVEIALREVDTGLVEAARSMGARRGTIIWKVLLAEARPSIVLALSTSVISLLNYSAIAGTIGAGGIGDIAIRYGYQRYDNAYLFTTIVILIVIVQVVQLIASAVARKLSRR
ncbi:methionine ABC transporter permease [Subtercola boreus]|nr:methionine ABC transporter permease [Subtercola boreus]TQL52974.1 D-methionine transport system permease protein [Subtercola boreus]